MSAPINDNLRVRLGAAVLALATLAAIVFGVLLLFTVLLSRWRWWLALAIGVAATLTIEFVQLFLPARFSDPRDLLANTLGTLAGIALVSVVVRRPAG